MSPLCSLRFLSFPLLCVGVLAAAAWRGRRPLARSADFATQRESKGKAKGTAHTTRHKHSTALRTDQAKAVRGGQTRRSERNSGQTRQRSETEEGEGNCAGRTLRGAGRLGCVLVWLRHTRTGGRRLQSPHRSRHDDGCTGQACMLTRSPSLPCPLVLCTAFFASSFAGVAAASRPSSPLSIAPRAPPREPAHSSEERPPRAPHTTPVTPTSPSP
jgi:hypothetical protein